MEFEQKVFLDFIKKVGINGKAADVIIDFGEDGLYGATSDGILMVRSKMNKIKVKDYKAVGQIGIKQVASFDKILKRFNSKIKVDTDKNLFVITEAGKKAIIKLADPSFISDTTKGCVLKDLSVPYTMSFSMPTDMLKVISDDIPVLQTNGGKDKIFVGFYKKGNKIKVAVYSGENRLERELTVSEQKGDVNIEFKAETFSNAIGILSGESVILSLLTSDAPLRIEEKLGDTMTNTIYIAPVTEEEASSGEVVEEEVDVEEEVGEEQMANVN